MGRVFLKYAILWGMDQVLEGGEVFMLDVLCYIRRKIVGV